MNLNKAHKILEENKRVYNQVSKEFSGSRNELWPEFEELKKYICENEKVLDLGCGNGRLYKLFSEHNIDYTGIDFSEKLIEIAKKKYGDHFKVVDILSLPFLNENFDSVWSIAVLHHIPSTELRKRVLSEIKRVLRPNGRVIVTCWNLYQLRYLKILLKSFLSKDIYVPFQGEKRYYHAFTKRELKKLFKESGFKIEEIRFLKRNNKKLNILIVATL